MIDARSAKRFRSGVDRAQQLSRFRGGGPCESPYRWNKAGELEEQLAVEVANSKLGRDDAGCRR